MEIKVGNKTLNITKWKPKQRKEFVGNLKSGQIDENIIMNSLVYENIDKDIVLSPNEFKYVLSRIRAYTLGEAITFNFYCDACNKEHKQILNLSDILTYTFKDIKEIKSGNVHIKLGDIKNKEFYNKMTLENFEDIDIIDFVLRIKSINGDDTLSFEETLDLLDNLDLDIFDNIIAQWESAKFKVNQIHPVKCAHCGDEQLYDFDDIPDFIPVEWIR